LNFLYLLDEKISQVEKVLIAALLTVMLLLAFLQIVLRNFFATGIDWSDSLVRYLVVWVRAADRGWKILYDMWHPPPSTP